MWIILSLTLIGLKYFGIIDWTWTSVWELASAPIWIPWILAIAFSATALSGRPRRTPVRRTRRSRR